MDEFVELRNAHSELNKIVDQQREKICKLEVELEGLDQYSRRENVCFTNLLVDAEHSCEQQVVDLCGELRVDIKKDDLVAAHPLRSKGRRVNLRVTSLVLRTDKPPSEFSKTGNLRKTLILPRRTCLRTQRKGSGCSQISLQNERHYLVR